MEIIRQYKGDCMGVQLYERPDMNTQFNIIVEDDEHWHESGFHASAYWIDELIEMLTLAKQYLDTHSKTVGDSVADVYPVEVPPCPNCGESKLKPSWMLGVYSCNWCKWCGKVNESSDQPQFTSNGMERDEICNITCRKKYADCNSPACWRRLAWEKEDKEGSHERK